MNHVRIRQVEKSMRLHGQLQPVVARVHEGTYQLIDGLKRFHCATNLKMGHLQCRSLDVDLAQAKVLLLSYNRPHQSMDAWEEALVLHDLLTTHSLDQRALAEMTGYSRSWVSRRLSLIERMDPDLSSEIMLGVITSSHARELIKLPRGNQAEITRVITSHNLTSRQSGVLIDAFCKAVDQDQQRYIKEHPVEIIEQRQSDKEQGYDPRLSAHGNDLLGSIYYVQKSLGILVVRLNDHRTNGLNDTEKIVVKAGLQKVLGYSRQVTDRINQFTLTKP
jgi:ParB/RepB/Spo0J family partition protein